MNDLSKLTKTQFEVTQNNGTESPYSNEFWDFFEEGIYLDIVSGEVLFSSTHKFPSSCGWPAFYKALEFDNIKLVEDMSHGMNRVEVRSHKADSHLGHLFNDGPAPTGIRYCINSAALDFVARKDLASNSTLATYEKLFEPRSKISPENLEFLTLGAGCFWGVEAILAKTEGIVKATSGYAGGKTVNPTYEDICTGNSGHAEVVQIEYDKMLISTEEVLSLFFKLHDPTTMNRQGADTGTQYRSVIYYHNESQRELAESKIKVLNDSGQFDKPIVTEVTAFNTFYPAEDYHQKYYDKKYKGGFGPICHFVRGV